MRVLHVGLVALLFLASPAQAEGQSGEQHGASQDAPPRSGNDTSDSPDSTESQTTSSEGESDSSGPVAVYTEPDGECPREAVYVLTQNPPRMPVVAVFVDPDCFLDEAA